MVHNKNIYIISDLHLRSSNIETAKLFKIFLEKITHSQNQLFILGDFFDYWIGDNHKDKFYEKITLWLKNASDEGLKIFFIRGNRDFLVGKKFAKKTNIILLEDPFYLNLNKKKILLSHGDIFCTSDNIYQWYRKWIAYNFILRFLFKCLPIFIKKYIAVSFRKTSYRKNNKQPNIDVIHNTIDNYLNDSKIIIHGHTHKMKKHIEKTYVRYVLGDWFESGNYIKINQKGEIIQIKI